ncbi:MAG TPA: hypothetical protein VFP54_03700 [Acidimicrobiales bacterium]|nr:hypothetical protein [Acidimicrobiales bacterium]
MATGTHDERESRAGDPDASADVDPAASPSACDDESAPDAEKGDREGTGTVVVDLTESPAPARRFYANLKDL